MPTPIDYLRDFFKTTAETLHNQREKVDKVEATAAPYPELQSGIKRIRSLTGLKPITSDPNYVDITPKQVKPKWYQNASDPAFAPDPIMRVMKPPMSRQSTEVLGGPEFARGVEKMFTAVPELRGRVKRIQHGPNRAAINVLGLSGFNSDQFSNTNLMGIYSPTDNEIAINPLMSPEYNMDFDTTLGHEFGHSFGMDHGDEMNKLEEHLEKWPESNFFKSNERINSYPSIQALKKIKPP